MRSEGFPFIVWGSGGWTRVRFVCCVPAQCSRGCVVNSVPCGLASGRVSRGEGGRAFRVVTMGVGRVAHVACVALCHGDAAVPWGLLLGVSRGAVPWGLLVGVSHVWRCAMMIATGRVAWVALCHGDCYWACRVGGAVPWGLLLGVSRRWRCAMGIAARVGGAVPWGLLLGVSRGWRRVLGIAGGRVAWVAPCLGDCWWACRVGGAVSLGLLTRAS